MALTMSSTGGGGAIILHTSPNQTFHPLRRHLIIPSSSSSSRTLHIASAKKQEQLSSLTGRYDSKNRRRSSSFTTTTDDDEGAESPGSIVETVGPERSTMESRAAAASTASNDGYFLPELPGDKPDFWEGEQWDALGFFVQYMWAFGVVFALIACGIAVATYNEGATDFKETPVYKESMGSRELLEEQPDANSDVFESNPTEVAPSLE